MAQAYYRVFRPLTWEEVLGQEHVVQTLKNAVAAGRVGHAYLFAGPRGTGKTTTARLLAKAVNCLAENGIARPCNQCEHCLAVNNGQFLDLIEIDAASNTSVEDVRDLRDKINFLPSRGTFKVYIIDEVHMLSTAAFNALLKTLEEPPAHAIFVLATTEIHRVPATVLSRCQRHEFRRIPLRFIEEELRGIAQKENIKCEPAALTFIARQATGSMRDAVSLLDQLASTGEEISLTRARDVLGTAASDAVIGLAEAIAQSKAAQGIAVIQRALDEGSDARQLARQTVDYLRQLLLLKLGDEEVRQELSENLQKSAQIAGMIQEARLVAAIERFNRAGQISTGAWQPGLQLELALHESLAFEATDKTEKQNSPSSTQKIPAQEKQAVKVIPPAEIKHSQQPKMEKLSPERKSTEKSSPVKQNSDTNQLTSASEKQKSTSFPGFQEKWLEIKALVKKRQPGTEALLNSCRLVSMQGGIVQLGFASELLKSKMESGAHKRVTAEAVRDVLALEAEIRCFVAGQGASLPPAELDIDSDGMVGTALALGGKISTHKQDGEA